MGMGTGLAVGSQPEIPELYTARSVTGGRLAAVLHLLPEIGYQWTSHIVFSLQGRYQFVQTDLGAGCNGCPQPQDRAWAVLGRAYLFTDGHLREREQPAAFRDRQPGRGYGVSSLRGAQSIQQP